MSELTNDRIMITTRMIAMMRAFLLMGLLPLQNFSDSLFRLAARKHHFVAAADTFELNVHTDAGDREHLFAAGMRFFHLDLVAQSQIHHIYDHSFSLRTEYKMTIKGMVIIAMFFGCRVSGEKNGIFDKG